MINRRQFNFATAAGAITLGSAPVRTLANTPTQDVFVFDAMGEIRAVYTDELCGEMIDSGLNAVTVTLCDPKSYETEAYEWAMAGILEYNQLISDESEFWFKATSVEDIATARKDKQLFFKACISQLPPNKALKDSVQKVFPGCPRSCRVLTIHPKWFPCVEGRSVPQSKVATPHA